MLGLLRSGRMKASPLSLLSPRGAAKRCFSAYDGQTVSDDQLIKKSDDWVIEETNFCLGRVAEIRFKETDDLAHRVLHLMDLQLPKMHTRLRDGTCIPYTGFYLSCVLDKPTPLHIFQEQPLVKWTWDETYDEAYYDEMPTKPQSHPTSAPQVNIRPPATASH